MKEFLYKIRASRDEILIEGFTPLEETVLIEHFNYLKELCSTGIVVLFGRTQNTEPGSFGIVIFRAAAEKIAWDLMVIDPAVKERIMRAKLFPYKYAGMIS